MFAKVSKKYSFGCNVFTALVVFTMLVDNGKQQVLERTAPEHNDKLVEGCLKGDRRAQHRFYRKYAHSMYNISMRIVNHSGEAEDILQESFIDAFDRLKDFRMEASVGSWLKKIVVNNSVNWLRRRRINWTDIDSQELEIEDQEEGWEEITLRVREIKEGMQQLPDGYRVVLSLYLLEGYDHEEIGRILSIKEASSRSQYLRAKRKLLEILKCRQYGRQA